MSSFSFGFKTGLVETQCISGKLKTVFVLTQASGKEEDKLA